MLSLSKMEKKSFETVKYVQLILSKFHWEEERGTKWMENSRSVTVAEICQQQGNIWEGVEACHLKNNLKNIFLKCRHIPPSKKVPYVMVNNLSCCPIVTILNF